MQPRMVMEWNTTNRKNGDCGADRIQSRCQQNNVKCSHNDYGKTTITNNTQAKACRNTSAFTKAKTIKQPGYAGMETKTTWSNNEPSKANQIQIEMRLSGSGN